MANISTTMESEIVPGVRFAGEVLDIVGFTEYCWQDCQRIDLLLWSLWQRLFGELLKLRWCGEACFQEE